MEYKTTAMGKVLILWQNIISPHQLPFINQLPIIEPNNRYILVVEQRNRKGRVDIGWKGDGVSNDIELFVAPKSKEVKELLLIEGAIHIFSGIRGFDLGWNVFKKAAKLKKEIYIISEAPDLRGFFRNIIRRMASFLIERRYRSSIRGVFAIGEIATNWYSWCRFERERLHPFCYVVHKSNLKRKKEVERNSIVKYIFVGSLIKLKGLIELIQRFSQFTNYQLDIYGNGVEKEKLLNLVSKLGVEDKIYLKGVKENSEIRDLIQNYDYLILPSLYDGWGAVINEALMEGVPVLVSTACGSASLVKKNPILGLTFDVKNIENYHMVLDKSIKECDLFRDRSNLIRNWAEDNISGKSIATEFLSIINGQFP